MNNGKVRYFDLDEEARLKNILLQRDEDLKKAREQGNEWKKERSYELLPDLRHFEYGDHMTPMILLSLNTGLRRGEVFSLQWSDVNFDWRRNIRQVLWRSRWQRDY